MLRLVCPGGLRILVYCSINHELVLWPFGLIPMPFEAMLMHRLMCLLSLVGTMPERNFHFVKMQLIGWEFEVVVPLWGSFMIVLLAS